MVFDEHVFPYMTSIGSRGHPAGSSVASTSSPSPSLSPTYHPFPSPLPDLSPSLIGPSMAPSSVNIPAQDFLVSPDQDSLIDCIIITALQRTHQMITKAQDGRYHHIVFLLASNLRVSWFFLLLRSCALVL